LVKTVSYFTGGFDHGDHSAKSQGLELHFNRGFSAPRSFKRFLRKPFLGWTRDCNFCKFLPWERFAFLSRR